MSRLFDWLIREPIRKGGLAHFAGVQWLRTSKYTPHQGVGECARRRKQMGINEGVIR